MNDLERKLDLLCKIKSDLDETNRMLILKNGQFNDLIKDISINHLGVPKETENIGFPELLLRSYNKGKLV